MAELKRTVINEDNPPPINALDGSVNHHLCKKYSSPTKMISFLLKRFYFILNNNIFSIHYFNKLFYVSASCSFSSSRHNICRIPTLKFFNS